MKVSFIVPARNKEHFIRNTAQSVLLQTYSPMEIVFSDQGSTDDTLGILLDMAETYNGPNTVRVIQCPHTERKGMPGLNAHLNWLHGQIDSDIVIMCSADDLNNSKRAELTVKAFEEHDPSYVNTGVIYLNPNDPEDLPKVTAFPDKSSRWLQPAETIKHQIGSSGSSAWARDLYEKHGPLEGCEQQDMILPMMALIERGIYYVDEPLHTYIAHASLDNTGFIGQINAAENEVHKMQLVELNDFINVYNWTNILRRWTELPEQFAALASDDAAMNALTEKISNCADAWSNVRNHMIINDVYPIKMRT
jgi:glycosyltransferase involved in cell wall biosynthesis